MDPRNYQTPSSSYVGLLNSQDGSGLNENFPYQSFHSSVNYGESEMPPFSSQQAEHTPVERHVRRKWSPADDEVLISAWLNTSKDAIVGNDQKLGKFWKRVGEYFTESPHGQEDGERRGDLTCKKRWHRINDQVTKFCGAYSAAERQIGSGESDTDVLKKAHDIFYSDQQTKFTLEHAWCVLRFEQKWLSLNTPKATASSKRKDGEIDPSTTVLDQEVRPEGCKAAKQKRSTVQGKSVADYTTIWEMKKEDLAMKERLSMLAILDSLLAKKEPLTEPEEGVKNKLLAKYFQPSQSDDLFGNSDDGGYSETEDLIRRDQVELGSQGRSQVQYPPQPEVEYGFPQTCYCGATPLLATSTTRNDPGRRYYTCENVDDGECHVWKWWDVAVMEEMRARDRHVLQLSEKVENLSLYSEYETDQRLARVEKIVSDIGKEQSKVRQGFEYFVVVMLVVTVLMAFLFMVK
ncbi:hypothetical protein YC2023_104097 [Brassica napus]